MRAVRLHEFGSPEQLRWEEVPDPQPSAGQVRIRVEASGVHLLDTALRRGEPGPLPLPELPTIPGREVAGTVDLVGAEVDPAWLGRRVVAHLGAAPGGYAEEAVVGAASLHAVPDDVDADVAIAMIGTGRTAMAILDAAAIGADDVVVVPAAAGGLGNLLCQAAQNAGATVVGVAGGPAKVALLDTLGVDVALDALDPAWPDHARARLGERRASVVLDGVGGEVGSAALGLLGPAGRALLFGWSSGSPTPLDGTDLVARGLTVSGAIGPRIARAPGGIRSFEVRALAAAADGVWSPLVQRFPLADAAGAHRALEERRTVGKVVLVADP